MTLRPCLSPSAFIAAVLLICLANTAHSSDAIKEQRWAVQIKEQLMVGQPLQIAAGQESFFALYTPASSKIQRGGVVLLHGLGAHPDWPEVISPLREGLPESGWATLSIQLPVWPNSAKFEDYPPLFPAANERITAAIQQLQQKGLTNIVLVGHSLGAAMGAYFLAEKSPGSNDIRAFVGIGMNQAPGSTAHTPDALAKISVPVFDLYGVHDLDGVLSSAKARAAAQIDNRQYRQTVIPGADHFFSGLETSLTKRVAGWLKNAAPNNSDTK